MERLSWLANLMLVSDLDDTMVDHSDHENLSLLRFNALWEANYRENSLLVFSTGRSSTLYKQLRKEKPLLMPDVAIMSVGTEIAYGESLEADDEWKQFPNQKWNRRIVTEEAAKFPELSPQLEVKIIYSNRIALDILPQGAGKGQARAYLLKKLKVEGKLPNKALACGDFGNDIELFTIPHVYGVMVNNAQEQLLQWHAVNAQSNSNLIHATDRCAAGVLEAIDLFNLGPSISLRDVRDFSNCNDEYLNPGHEVVKFYLFYEMSRRAEVENSGQYMQNLKTACHSLGIFVHPCGIEQPFQQRIDALDKSYGDMQGKQFHVWLDHLLPLQIGSDTWLMKFQKWELFVRTQQGCLTTLLLSSRAELPNCFRLIHMHQTWLDGYGDKNPKSWLI